ncbi:ATP-binding protein [Streptomyces antibioticus]|uniref:ATP-binding protein n=1 Tax=Streptomyces antibioticus TaxID=1890 RepID=UPI00369F960E
MKQRLWGAASWRHADPVEDIRLCVSELAANAVLHGVPPGREFSLEADADGPLLRVGVSWAGADMCSGRGLRLVVALADDFGAIAHRLGEAVWVIQGRVPEASGG